MVKIKEVLSQTDWNNEKIHRLQRLNKDIFNVANNKAISLLL